ncbi:MAG: beta-ketoacyl-[acyl-carrier-protein] synthase family protein [Deltaproteobacteria bacterium]|nr:beta-ketoacyl-[acyl-carrier-protein] synthase family protein [Deltaproteobacteria bacterium]
MVSRPLFPGEMMPGQRVVITGRGVVSPLGIGVEGHQRGLLAGRSVIRRSERLSASGFPLSSAGEIPDETLKNSTALIPQRQKKLMSRAGILAAIASMDAAREAKLEETEIDPNRVGIFLGTWLTFFSLSSFLRYLGDTESGREPRVMDSEKANLRCLETMNPVDYSLKVLPNLAAGHLAIFHRAQGCSRVIADCWRAGLLAVAQAAQAIGSGELDVILAGGTESPLEEGIFCDLCTLEVVARDRGEPDPICRPFDARRRGAVLGEGAGMVVLEERGHALRRGMTFFGEITGSACSAPGPAGCPETALGLSMKKALLESKLDCGEVDFVHANGDSTPDYDRAEWQAVKSIFGLHATAVPVTATKSLHGHLLSASGAVELISSLMMLQHGVILPIANCDNPDPECGLDLVRDTPRVKSGMRSALLNAFGLFGEAASLVIQR